MKPGTVLWLVRLLVAVLVPLSQLGMAAPGPRLHPLQAADGGLPICHAGQDPVDQPARHDHPQECILCALCFAATAPALLASAGGSLLFVPRLEQIGLASPLPPAIAPPAFVRLTARPRAPPVLQV